MVALAFSAALIGAFHSLAPGHWLPVVLMAKTRHWGLGRALLGAFAAAAGHIVVSIVLGLSVVLLGDHWVPGFEEKLEHYGGLGLIVFGIAYAGWAYRTHSHCTGHTHHGPEPKKGTRSALGFLFSVGLSPCVAALPLFVASAAGGMISFSFTLVAFAVGVVLALSAAVALVSYGFMKLDHPIFEHYGDILTGFAVAVVGAALFLLPHSHG